MQNWGAAGLEKMTFISAKNHYGHVFDDSKSGRAYNGRLSSFH